MTDAERLLWRHLRAGRLDGVKFRRQHPVSGYVADFCAYSRGLIIELDGGQHADQVAYDARRSEALSRKGYRVIRFWDNEVLTNMEGVLEAIRTALMCPSPQPSPGGRGGIRASS